jgi:coproporphyrinogen III oxidase-like Fe-S oxidoreductase
MDKVQETTFTDYNAPSSESFALYRHSPFLEMFLYYCEMPIFCETVRQNWTHQDVILQNYIWSSFTVVD